jgi:lysozyme
VGVQAALINMRFQMGPGGFRGFRKMVAALRRFDFKTAADEAMDSNWYKQTPSRAMRVVDLIRRAG